MILKLTAHVRGDYVHKHSCCQFIIKILESHSPVCQESLLQHFPVVTEMFLWPLSTLPCFTLIFLQVLITFIRSPNTVLQLSLIITILNRINLRPGSPTSPSLGSIPHSFQLSYPARLPQQQCNIGPGWIISQTMKNNNAQ